MLDASSRRAPRPSPDRARILVLGVDRPLLHRRRASSPTVVLLLRRHHPDVLPGLAARVHHQPGRHPDQRAASRACRGSWRRSSSTSRSWRSCCSCWSSSSPAPWRPRSPSSSRRSRTSRRTCRRSSRRGRTGSTRIGLGQIDLVAQVAGGPRQPRRHRGPARRAAPADRGRQPGVVGTLLIVFFLSIYMVVDRDQILALPVPARPAGLRRGGPAARDVGRRARSAASCAARRSWASSTS